MLSLYQLLNRHTPNRAQELEVERNGKNNGDCESDYVEPKDIKIVARQNACRHKHKAKNQLLANANAREL